MYSDIAIITLTAKGAELAEKIKQNYPGSQIHGKQDRVKHADITFTNTRTHLQSLYIAKQKIIGICASGILVRLIAPVIGDKHQDPPLIAISEDGRHVIPLLGGHSGANKLSEEIASHLKTQAAVTTISDGRFCSALDNPPDGWTLANPEHYKKFMASILGGQDVNIDPAISWLSGDKFNQSNSATFQCKSTIHNEQGNESTLIYVPKTLVIGVGCERHTPAEDVIKLIGNTIDQAQISTSAIAAIVSVDLKIDEQALESAADFYNLPLRFFDVDTLESITPRLANPSDTVFCEIGCHGVAEASALAMAGVDSTLLVTKKKSRQATCAIAHTVSPIKVDMHDCTQKRGHLYVVSLGPGSQQWRSPQATHALTTTTDWVGYSYYLDLANDCYHNQLKHDFGLGEEINRVEKALQLASEGKQVALICSGDAGIYAMGALVFESLDSIPYDHNWQKPEVTMLPGISALQAAAAKSGAILGHDFAVISLSDLLTPWENIAKRIEAAAQADFVLAFYNPVSKRRTTQLAYAKHVLLKYRSEDTPVIIARQLGRDEENITLLPLAELEVGMIDMLCIVLIGSSSSTLIKMRNGKQWVYTPRGYDNKHNEELI